jgi:hypothetical protein
MRAVEAVEDSFRVTWRHARTFVGNPEDNASIAPFGAEMNSRRG